MSHSARVNLLTSLINASEKAANIARICRSNEQLLALLVQEKSEAEANARFDHDFKTLADVLIQETIKHDIGTQFPEMKDAIKGEESPNFTNKLGDSVAVAICEAEVDTAECLSTVLHGYEKAAAALAAEVHRNIIYDGNELGKVPELPEDLDYTNLAVWIDPIDATAEYITGDSIFTDFPGITSTGLDCVTVLIGVYERSTGVPIIGVISQPFHNKVDENVYKSHVYWGVMLPNLQTNNCHTFTTTRTTRLGIFSSSENADILQSILNLGYEFAFSAGAGHKALKVITKEVDLYLLSKASTFKWDTCGPQAILRSLGGNIFDVKQSIEQEQLVAITYRDFNEEGGEEKCNKGGLIAVCDVDLAEGVIKKLSEK